MRISNWMKHPVHAVKPLDSLRHARHLMEEHRVNQLPVVTDGHLVGIVTDRDLRDAFPSALEHGHRKKAGATPETVPVEDVMSRNVMSVAPNDSLANAAEILRRERIGAVPVVDGGRLVGILARSDLLEAFSALSALVDEKHQTKTQLM